MKNEASFRVPGFGCSYWLECDEQNQNPRFLLKFAKRTDRFSWKQQQPGAMFLLEAGECHMKHIWKRRLQDARLLLRTGRFRVADVATFVGSANGSAKQRPIF